MSNGLCVNSLGNVLSAKGLGIQEKNQLDRLIQVWSAKLLNNQLRRDYYYMHVNVDNIGIAVSQEFSRLLNVSCGWPAKAVDMLAERSIPDGFAFESGRQSDDIQRILRDNNFEHKYPMAVKSELMHSTMAWTLSPGRVGRSRVRIKCHSAETAAMLWDGGEERIECGMAIIDWQPIQASSAETQPSVVNLYTPDCTVVLTRSADGRFWSAEYKANPMGRPLMEPMSYEPTMMRPFGKSRITRAVMSITMNKLREDMRTEISAEFNTAPQKFLLGADEEAFDMDRYKAYVGNIFLVGKDEDGDVPQFGQLPQVSLTPHIEYARSLAAQFSGETSIPVSSLGVVTDNPTSAEAIEACERDMVQLAQNLNRTNAQSLRNVALMALAMDRGVGCDMDVLTDDELSIDVNWHDPSMPNIAATADAWLKMASAPGAEYIAQTDEYLEGMNLPRHKRARMLAEKRLIDGRSVLNGMGAGFGDDTKAGVEPLQPDAEGKLQGGGRVRVEGAGGSAVTQGGDGSVLA